MARAQEKDRSQGHVQPYGDVIDIQLLSIPQVAAILSIKRTTVYRLIKQEGLPAIPLGENGDLRVRRAALQQWILNWEAR